jgi:hypothetical protein
MNGDLAFGSMREDAYALWANAGWPMDAASVPGLSWSAENDENAEIILTPKFLGLHGPLDAPAWLEVCSTRGWACDLHVGTIAYLRERGTTGEKRIAGAAAFEDERRRVWARAAGLA